MSIDRNISSGQKFANEKGGVTRRIVMMMVFLLFLRISFRKAFSTPSSS